MEEIKLNLDNLTEDERFQLMTLVEKANMPKPKVWEPQLREKYYLIYSNGEIGENVNNLNNLDSELISIGNAFRTKEEAEEEVQRRKIQTQWTHLSVEAGEAENQWNMNNAHWSCFYSYTAKEIQKIYSYTSKDERTYFPSKESLESAIEKIGEENVKRYILDIKDE